MTVKELEHLMNRECYFAMVEIDQTNGDYYPRDLLSLSKKEDIELIEQVGDLWEIERIETASDEGDLLFINYRRKEEDV